YLNEAVADYFTGQVAGALDYGWADNTVSLNSSGDYCSEPATLPPDSPNGPYRCFAENINTRVTSGDGDANIGRISTLLHDAFDGHGQARGSLLPNDADPWELSVGTDSSGAAIRELPLLFSASTYQDQDGDLERVSLPGQRWKDFA